MPYFFRNRMQGGQLLGAELLQYKHLNPIILALPKGGVEVGLEVAKLLNAQFDVIVSHKIEAPGEKKLNIGAVAEGGILLVNQPVAHMIGMKQKTLASTIAHEAGEMLHRVRAFRGARFLPSFLGRTVILVDSGINTGVTMRAAIQSIEQRHPKKIIVAVPVAAFDAYDWLSHEIQVVALFTPPEFGSLRKWYQEFEPVDDRKAVALLQRSQ